MLRKASTYTLTCCQFGERPHDARHCYANPFEPEVCFFLSLGVYFLCWKPGGRNRPLFPGDDQYQRFSEFLCRIARAMEEELKAHGVSYKDIGTHSCRKGSASLCSSGSTSCPPMAAICLRAGWSLGTVQDKYIRYEGELILSGCIIVTSCIGDFNTKVTFDTY